MEIGSVSFLDDIGGRSANKLWRMFWEILTRHTAIDVLDKWHLQGCNSFHAKGVNAGCHRDTPNAGVRVEVRMSHLHHPGRENNTLGRHLS